MQIIEKCRSCFLDITSEEVASVLAGNNIEPLKLNEFDIKFADIFFKKGIELVQLRNILIHTHYEGGFFDWDPITKLDGVKDKRVATGYKKEHFHFDVNFLENLNQQMEIFSSYIVDLNCHIYSTEGLVRFKMTELNKLLEINFKVKN